MKAIMPGRTRMNDAIALLEGRRFAHVASLMVHDAHEDGVTDFGMLFTRKSDGARFWLNYKTIDNLPDFDHAHETLICGS